MRINIPLIVCVYKLGIANVVRVAFYRIALKAGYYKRKLPVYNIPIDNFFTSDTSYDVNSSTKVSYFSKHPVAIEALPDWFANPWQPAVKNTPSASHWSELSDFDNQIGDIKTVWELSRFDWVPKMAWAYKHQPDSGASLDRLESWLRDWTKKNPVNQGLNWKCAQEASLRAMNLLVASKILGVNYQSPTTGVLDFYIAHIKRILPTTHYAKAQDNNHGTSEAIALFCLGAYVHKYGASNHKAVAAQALSVGRKLLENRVRKLILRDGTFSQNSLTYHRLMLDTMCLCEIMRISHNEKKFSDHFYWKLSAATDWLGSMLDLNSGDGPNLGANDGAYFLNLEDKPYRDFRNTLKRSLVLFANKNLAYPATDALLDIYDIDCDHLELFTSPDNRHFADGGYARLTLDDNKGHLIFRFPKYRFRPSGCDGAHLDLWHGGENITLDSGSYSYNTDDASLQKYFGSTLSHCTVQFDDHEQMPKISRMLRGHWLKPDYIECDLAAKTLATQYTDHMGCVHARSIKITPTGLIVEDSVSQFKDTANIVWRLGLKGWKPEGTGFVADNVKIDFSSTEQFEIVSKQAENSRYYLHKEKVVVIKLVCKVASTVVTKIDFG